VATIINEFFTRLGFQLDESALKNAQTKIAGLGKTIMGLGIFSGLSVAGIVALTTSTADALGPIQNLSERSGIATDTIAAMSKAAFDFDVPAESMRNSLESVNRALGGIITGTAPRMVRVFKAIGLSATDAAGKQKDVVEFFGDVAVNRVDTLSQALMRAVTRTTSGAIELIMQPSRADDDVLLWQALRAYQLQLGPSPWSELPPGSSHVTPHVSPHVDRTGNAERRREGAGAAGETGSARATGRESRPLAACTDDLRARAWCDAAFTVANRDDAYFFAHWLDYHFAELRARARMHNVLAELCDVHTRVTDHEVEVRFAFREDERVVRGSTRAVCRWIAAEAVRQLDMPLEHWLSPNMSGVSALRIGRPYRTTLASAPRGYPS